MTAPDHSIRPLEPGDIGGLLDCVRELQAYERRFEPRMTAPEEIGESYHAWLVDACREAEGVVLVADAGGEIAGYVCVLARVQVRERDEVDYDHALVADLVVRERWRGRGLGQALLDAAQAHAVEKGARWLRIAVLTANERAREVYERFGFRPRLLELEKDLASGRPDR